MVGQYGLADAPSPEDKYQHHITADFVNLLCSLSPVSEYAGQHAIEDNLLWHFFFPPSYQVAQPNNTPIPGRPRMPEKFAFKLITKTDISLGLFFVNAAVTESFCLLGLAESKVELNVPWVIDPDGFVSTLCVSFVQAQLQAQHLWSKILHADELKLNLRMHYPREWNMTQTWDIDLDVIHAQLVVLFDYKRFFKSLFEDWTRGAHPDLLSFVPCIYKFRVAARSLNFVLIANDYNWVSSTTENAHISFWGKRFLLSFELPFIDFLPATVPIIYKIESELEELALRGLRPEGSQTQGPTEDDLLKSDFDASYFAPDTVDVHLHIAQAQLCFYGTLLRHFAHLKENYFGCYQRPVDFAGPPMSAQEYQNHLDEFSLLPPTDAPNASVKRSKVKRIIDPRECRPILVRLSIEGHNIQAHLPTDNRPKTSGALAKGRLQLMGFCLRGQGLFSHLGLPLAAETVEYAWLLELHVGRITGQLTAPQLAGIVHALNGFLFTMTDPENQLICSRDFELCQHAKPQFDMYLPSCCVKTCPQNIIAGNSVWDERRLRPLHLSPRLIQFHHAQTATDTNPSENTCTPSVQLADQDYFSMPGDIRPGRGDLVVMLLRSVLDGLDVAVVESGACLSLQLEPVRLSNCNMHGPAQRNGLFAILPGVRLVQYIRPSVCESEDAKAKRFGTPTNAQRVLQLRWIEAGSLSLGPVHITMSHSPEQPELPIWQLAFLRRHDARTKRLWFLWSDFSRRSFPQTKSPQSSPSKHAMLTVLPNCGCYGQCSFFGLNESGRQLYYELSSGVFKPRTVFPPRSVYRPDLCTEPKASEPGTGSSVVSEYLLFHSEVTARDNLPESSLQATLFGESLLIPHRLMHELHNPSVCLERLNGLLLMREELIAAAQAAESLNMEHGKGLCCEDSELSDETSVSISGATQSYPTSLSDMSGDFAVRIDETVSLDFGRKHPHRHTSKTQLEERRTNDTNLIRPRSSRPSSGSELLVPPDSGDEIQAEGNPLMETDLEKRTRRLTSHLPSNLSLNSLMNSLTPSSSSSSFLRDNDNVDKPFPVTDLTKPPVPPTPPPRRFTTLSLDENGAPKPNEPAVGAEPRHLDDKKEIPTDPFDKFVDLRSQLHRPITESGLLRSAYARHLSVYECHSGWAEGISLNQRWHVCKHIYSGFGFKNSGSSSLTSLPSPRLGVALAPRFQLVQPGFCPRSITLCADETKRSCEKSTTYKGGRDQHTIAQRVSPSNVAVWLHNSVEILLSPLFTESLERYVKVLTPVLANTPASTVVDSMHSTCVKLRASQIPKQNQSETAKVSTHLPGTPAPSVPDSAAHRIVLTGVSSQSTSDSSMLKSLPAHKFSASNMFPHSGLTASRKSTVDSPVETLSLGDSVLQSSISSSTQPKPVVSTRAQGVGFDSRRKSVPNRSLYDCSGSILMGGKFAALTVEQINVCFIQLYAVEDLVHLDSLRSGLQDLTCVSLLALCVDSVSFECSSAQVLHICNASASACFSDKWALTRRAKFQYWTTECTILNRDSAASTVKTKSPGLPRATQDTTNPDSPPGNGVEAPKTLDEIPPDQSLDRTGYKLVCELDVRRIHVQLRRLTRCSQFNADVLLTAIPFESSRTFFMFESDPRVASYTPTVATHTVGVNESGLSVWDERSAGWIMFECGLERLSLSCNRRYGFTDSPLDVIELRTPESKTAAQIQADESVHRTLRSTSSCAGTESLPKVRIRKSTNIRSVRPPSVETGTGAKDMPVPSHCTDSQPDRGEKSVPQKPETAFDMHPNGFVTRLLVNTVWLNFATPKRLPNKRRIKLVRSDWNLLSTAAPSIRAWMDPCYRLITACRSLYTHMERRFLAVTACLMTEAVNPKSAISRDKERTTFFHLLGDKELTAYARHRTQKAQTLRFDPSCQLLLVLRRYLIALGVRFGQNEADRRLNEWLHEPDVPPSDLLQCGILSLTREWRFLVELLALSAEDLRGALAHPSPLNGRRTPANAPPSLRRSMDVAKAMDPLVGKTSKRHRTLSKVSRTVADAFTHAPTSAPTSASVIHSVNFVGDPNSGLTSKLLRMAAGPISPTTNYTTYQTRRSKLLGGSNHTDAIPGTLSTENRTGGSTVEPAIFGPQLDFNWDSGHAQYDAHEVDKDFQNPILRRFLSDAKAPLADVLHANLPKTETTKLVTEALPQRLVTESSLQPPKKTIFPRDDIMQHPALSSDSYRNTSGSTLGAVDTKGHEHNQETAKLPEDVRVTTADIEQAAHLSAQFQHGIRRTALMKKFGGFFSADGLLEIFQVEIVSSTRNPMVCRPQTPLNPSGTTASVTGSSAHRRAKIPTPIGRQSAFLCRNFGSRLTLRDVVDHSDKKDMLPNTPGMDRFDLVSTTTKVHVMLSVDFLRQHVNLPLLRLVHQFITMVYCARDTRNALAPQPTGIPAPADLVMPTAQNKPNSKDSSDHTEDTLPSRSFAFVRFGDGSSGSAEQSEDAPDFAEYQVPLVPRDRLSGDLTSNSSAGKDSHLAEASSGIPTNPSLPQEEPVTQRVGAEPLISGNVPSCWQRLFNYVELYTTVPKTRMVIRKQTTTSFARRLLPAVAYRPLGEDVEKDAGCNPLPTSNVQLLFSAPSDSLNPATAPSSGANLGHSADHVPSSHQHQTGVSPSTFSQDPSDAIPMQRTPSTVGARLSSEPRMPVGAFEQFTYPWICSERLPLCIFITAKVHQMAVTAVLSELNLSAGVRNVHGSFVHSTQVRGRGSFTERYSSQCLSLHCDDGQLQLTERLPPIVHQVVCVRSGPSRALLSCSRSRQNERNSCLISVGRVTVTLPHHPVRLHGVMQRQAKRISSTMFELLRGSPALRSNSHSLNFAENAPTACRVATTPTTCSTTTTTTSDMTGQIGQSRPQPSNALVRLSTYSSSSSPPLVFSLLAVVQGLTLNVALHPTLTAIYHMDPVYFIGQLGPRGHVDIDLTDHSLSFRSLRPPVNFPQSVCLALPRIVTTVVRRISSGGRYSRGLRKEPIITEGLTAEQGLYLDIQVTVNTLEQTLTTDMLNYIVVVVKLFMREINEVIQKMAGEEQSVKGTTRLRPSYSSLVCAMNTAPKPHDTNGFLSRAARGKTKFTIRIRMKEIQLMATTLSGAVKLEAQKIDVELTNRVSQASINSNILSFPKSSTSENSGTRGPPRPSNLNLCSTSVLHWSPLSEQPYSSLEGGGDSLFIYASVGYICAELGYLDQDVLYKERSPEFKTVALFKTSIALRSLLADEKFASSSSNTGLPQTEWRYVPGGSCEHDAFLISLNRPTLWIKPFTFDRAILMWMVYKRELAKWNEHMKYLISMAAPVVEPSSRRSPVHKTTLSSSREHQPGVLEPVTSTPPPCTAPPTTTSIHSDTETSPQAQGGNALNRETHGDSSNASMLFLQLNVEELGVCFPINIFQSGVQSMEVDSRTALVLTLDRSRISACYRESLVSQSEFTDFCLRFDDEFNVGSDDWRPDWKRATVDVKGKPHLVILNACVVPSGTFSVCWRDLENRAQWHLIIRWQMRGLDFHLDDNIGRRIKALIGIVTRITGYRGAAPLLATSAEEEDEDFVNQSPVQEEKTDCATRSKTEVPVYSKQPLSVNSGGSRHRPRRPMNRDLLGRVSDNASLDGYIPLKSRTKTLPEEMLPDLAQVRSMELLKHKQELLEAQYCQAFKRQKWNTLRRRGPTLSRSPLLQTRLTGSSSVQRIAPLRSTSDRDEKVTVPLSPDWSQSTSFRSTLLESNADGSEPATLAFHAADPARPLSLLSGDESIYFDVDARDRDSLATRGGQTFDLSSSFESMTGEPNETNTNEEPKMNRRSGVFPLSYVLLSALSFALYDFQRNRKLHPVLSFSTPCTLGALYTAIDLWFDPLENPEANQIDADLLSAFPDDGFPADGPPDASSDSDDMDLTIRPETRSSHVTNDSATAYGSHAEKLSQPPPPPPRRACINERKHSPPLVQPGRNREPDLTPQVHLRVDVQIHVDSGCCVLHPRLPNRALNTDTDPRHGMDTWGAAIPPTMPNRTGSSVVDNTVLTSPRGNLLPGCSSRPQLECGLRSMGELLPGYLERYKRYLLQDPQFFATDLSIFYLPAVDIGLHYSSMTEVDLNSSSVEAFGIQPRPDDAGLPDLAGGTKSPVPRTADLRGCSAELKPDPDQSRINVTSSSQNAPVSSSLKKEAELYMSCFLQKLPQELVIHPALLDFLEQALEDIPLVSDVGPDAKSLSSEEGGSTGGAKKDSNESIDGHASSPSLDGLLLETFPVHTVVHLHIQPSAVRLLCLPTSRMQCFMVLPFMDAVFSTKRNSEESRRDSASNTVSNLPGNRQSTVLSDASELRSDISIRGTTVRLTPAAAAGDIISEGGLCVTAILKEFRISVFHPFGDVKSNRSDTNWGPAWSGDSLTLLIRDIQFSLSRTIQLSLIQLGPGNARGPEAGSFCTAVSSSERADSARLRYLTPIGATALTGSGSDTWSLHRAVRFSGVFDIGAAIFTCDTRRTLEILDIPKAWYRSSLARRLFLGNEDVIDGFQASELKRMATADDGLFQSPASPTADDNSTVEQESSQEHAFDAEVPLLDTESQTQPILSGKFRRLTCPASFPRDTEGTTKPEYCKTLGNSSDVPRPATNLVSHSITLAGERPSGRNTSPNGSLKVTSWNALPIFCVHLKRFDLNLYMGSAMGLTRMTIDNLFCDGRASIHSSGRKNTMLSTGLGTCQFTSEGGGVGGEFCLMDCDALIRLDDDPLRDPEHNLDCRIGGFQLRVEYMSTNILLVRLSSLSLHLQDEWRLRDVARQQLLLLSSSISNRPSSIGANSPSQRHPVTVGSRVPTTGFEESSGDMLQAMEEDIGVPPVYVRVVGEVNWDQAQTAIVRTTTPDLMRAVLKVREYFEEQVREGRMSLIGQTGSFGLFSSTSRDPHMTTSHWPGWYQSASYQDDPSNGKAELTETEIQIVDKLLQRHWQGLYGAVKAYAREHLGMIMGVTTDEPEPETSTSTADEKCPVLGGSFQLSGRSLGIACFAGSFRSAPDWAVFNIQYPTACFETEAQHEAPVCRTADTVIDPSELEGWVNVRQVLSFDLGSHPHFQPQMAYVLRVRRGRQPTAKTPPTLSITEWLEFAFRGADNTVSQFPVNFPSTLPATSSHPFVDVLSGPALSQARGFSDPSELGSSDSAVTAAQVIDPRAVHPWRYRLCGASIRKPNSFPAAPTTTSGTGSVSTGSTLTVTATTTSPSDVMVTDNNAGISSSSAHTIGSSTTDSVPVQPVPPVRSNPLKPPSDAEILFVLPSISLRITSDQRQTMAQPSLSSLPFIQIPVTATGADDTQAASKSESLASDTLTGDPAASGHTVKSSRLWFYGPRNTSATKETDSAKETNVSSTASRGFDCRQPFSPSVKISFQTDFHGFVQLGLIDVPWLPTLISSYLNERLQEYELTSASANEARGAFGVSSRYTAAGSELTARLRQIAATSSPLVHDARSYEIVHWSLSPECRWLLATSIGVPAFDRLLESVGFRKARITIPKWLQRGVMDHLDHVTSILLRASLHLITDESLSGNTQTGDSKVVQSGPRITVDISNKRTFPPSVKTHVAEKPANSKSSFPRPSFTLSVDED
ncbi:hypothetical protein FGIG_04519 [Fasciola gigantica]|uniref:Bridge-like lipid transfer protein family member 1 C-terminal domain-containing protein n=1 Tax=Fasciola gigantica TaxID=46835 RepID=A0A504Z6A2_FASGI|nr:hypothetical protein FGIG_04519 [Fasciola gigantica]